MEHEGFSFQRFFDKESFLFVVVHAESDYFVPLKCADRIEIEVVVEHIGTTSFTIRYDVFREGISTGRMKTVHVCIDKSTRKKRPLPDEAILFLNKYKESH
ncbi:hypothetical protein EBR96_08235 [bacterium]|nr:hypothetical protein [bacterium]